MPQLAGLPVIVVEQPVVKVPLARVSNDVQPEAPVKGDTEADTSDTAPPLPALSGVDDLEGGNETTPTGTVTHDDITSRRFSLRKARSHNDFEVGDSLLA